MKRLLSVTAVLALLSLSFAACGDDNEETLTGAADTTNSSGSTAKGGIATAGAFLDASIPDQVSAVGEAVSAAGSTCKGVDTKAGGDFQVAVATDAASAPPDTPLSEIVSGQCSEN